MDINEIRNGALTEAAKMDKIADYVSGSMTAGTLDSILANGNTATAKTAKFETSAGSTDFLTVNDFAVSGQKTMSNGVATFRISSEGNFYVDFQPTEGSLSTFQVDMNNGTPRVVMSDDVKAAFKAELGIS